MRLKHYWVSGGSVEFDADTGVVTPERGETGLPASWGFVWKQRGRWFGLWHNGDCLVFQHGGDRWDLTSDVQLQVEGKLWRTFQICRGTDTEYEFSYWFKGSIAAHIDPTYDKLEEESDDFFCYVTAMWKYWKDRSPDDFEVVARRGLADVGDAGTDHRTSS